MSEQPNEPITPKPFKQPKQSPWRDEWHYNPYSSSSSGRVTYGDKRTLLQEAEKLIDGDRAAAYGEALKHYNKLAAVWGALLGMDLTAEQAVLMMEAMKVVRAFEQAPDPNDPGADKRRHYDSVLDIAGYAGVIDKIGRERGWW